MGSMADEYTQHQPNCKCPECEAPEINPDYDLIQCTRCGGPWDERHQKADPMAFQRLPGSKCTVLQPTLWSRFVQWWHSL